MSDNFEFLYSIAAEHPPQKDEFNTTWRICAHRNGRDYSGRLIVSPLSPEYESRESFIGESRVTVFGGAILQLCMPEEDIIRGGIAYIFHVETDEAETVKGIIYTDLPDPDRPIALPN